jgi:hypothetical protein
MRRPVERFEVRRLEEGQTQRTVALAAHAKPRPRRDEKVSPRPSWKSVSAALYKGMVFGAMRVMPK